MLAAPAPDDGVDEPLAGWEEELPPVAPLAALDCWGALKGIASWFPELLGTLPLLEPPAELVATLVDMPPDEELDEELLAELFGELVEEFP